MNSTSSPRLLVILGPTATGKTEVAVEASLLTGGEVVSADSMLVYMGMDIGTAKPGPEKKKGVPHHLIDVVSPAEDFSVARYKELACRAIEDIHSRGKQPVMAGGTGFFIQAVVDGLTLGEVEKDYDLREKLKEYAKRHGKEALHARLKEVDPGSASRLHPNDAKRVIRALEIYEKTGRPMSRRAGKDKTPGYKAYMFGLYLPREDLYERINRRVDKMIEMGLVEEVKKLLDQGHNINTTSMQGLGYKEIAYYLTGEIDLDRAIYLIKRNTRRFAKRQLTWFRRDKRINWIDISKFRGPGEIAGEIVDRFEGVKTYMSNF